MKNALLLFLVLINAPCSGQTCMHFRVDLFKGADQLLNKTTVTSLEMQNVFAAEITFYNCGSNDIAIDKNLILANSYDERFNLERTDDRSPLFVRVYKKEKGIYRYYTYDNTEVFNFVELPTRKISILKPDKEMRVVVAADYVHYLDPGEYEFCFDYVNNIDTTKSKDKLYPDMNAGCFHDTYYNIYNGFFFQTASNVIHFTVVADK